MEKFNAIKILEEEQYMEDLFNRNLGKEQYMKDVYNYVETYIRPLLEKNLSKANIPTPQYFIKEMRDEVLTNYNDLSDENKEIMMKESTIGAYYIHKLTEALIVSANQIINSLGLITEKQNIEDVDDEYNPTFLITFKYEDEHEYINEKLSLALELIHEAMEKAFNDIEGKEEEYN